MSDELAVLPAIDRENLFLLYSTFCGDLERTAHAAGIRPVDVLRAADAGLWNQKLEAIFALKKSATPGDVERGISRAIAFAQSHRLRMLLNRCITRLTNMTDAELDDCLFVPDKNGIKHLTTRHLCDLSSAVEKCNAQAAMALCDTAQDRARREEAAETGETSGGIHASIAAAMASVSKDCSPRAQLVEAQLATAQQIVKTTEKPVDNYSNDNH